MNFASISHLLGKYQDFPGFLTQLLVSVFFGTRIVVTPFYKRIVQILESPLKSLLRCAVVKHLQIFRMVSLFCKQYTLCDVAIQMKHAWQSQSLHNKWNRLTFDLGMSTHPLLSRTKDWTANRRRKHTRTHKSHCAVATWKHDR